MTRVTFTMHEGKIVSFHMKGHAMPREAAVEVDLVCAGISAISQTTLIGIEEVLKVKTSYKIEEGFLQLTLENCTSEEVEKCQVLLETMLLGLRSMELGYGNYIKVETKEV